MLRINLGEHKQLCITGIPAARVAIDEVVYFVCGEGEAKFTIGRYEACPGVIAEINDP
jgi:hypothetical protein